MNNQTSIESICDESNIAPQPLPFLHLSVLDSLRGIAALYVFLGHTAHQVAVDETQIPKIIRVMFRSLDFGAYAVVMFIVLSGFCLMLPVIRNEGAIKGSIKSFFFRRAKRILPPYYATLLISVGLASTILSKHVGNLWDGSIPVTAQGILTHILLIHDIFRSDIFQSNPSLWSIAVEFRIYFLFPLILIFWKKWGGWKTSLGALGSSYVLFAILSQFSFFNSEPPGSSLHYIALFTAGMLAAEIYFSETEWNRQLRKNIPWSLVAIVFFLLAVPASGIRYMRGISWILADLSAGIASMSLLVSLMSSSRHPLNNILKWKPLVKIGSFSYSIYLLHVPLMQVFIQYVSHSLHLPPIFELTFVFTVGVPLIIFVSYLFFLLAEKPFLSQRARQTL